MPTVNATAGSSSANSYADVAGADAYFADTFGRPLWVNSETSDKEALLITASRTLDQFMTWEGYRATDEQSMEWPRVYTYDRSGASYDKDIIPKPVVFATYELAYHILEKGGMEFARQQLDKLKVGPIFMDFAESSTDSGIPDHVESLINHIGHSNLVDRRSARSVRLIRS